jgi:hypothetical protein
MISITTVTPIKIFRLPNGNLSRSIERIAIQLKSLRAQVGVIINPIVSDMSWDDDIKASIEEICNTYGAKYVHTQSTLIWNKPLCLNIGIKMAKTRYTAALDADVIYRNDTFKSCVKAGATLVIARTFGLRCDFNGGFGRKNFNSKAGSGRMMKAVANGGIQFLKTKWVHKTGGYDERFNMWGRPDNEMVRRAKKYGTVGRLSNKAEIRLIHLYHPRHVTGLMSKEDEKICNKWRDLVFSRKCCLRPNKSWGNEQNVVGPRLVDNRIVIPTSWGKSR